MTDLRVAGGGSFASNITPEQELKRCVLACMLWEDVAYENGATAVDRIVSLLPVVSPEFAKQLAVDARNEQKLRHVPLLVAATMAKIPTHKHLVSSTLYEIIQRPDEITEFLALYWRNGKTPISNQVKKGLAAAFAKFDEYQLAKYNSSSSPIKLRDALFLVHAKPKDQAQASLWKRLVDNTLATPDTWEIELSASKDKKTSWERLLKQNRLGGLAMIRNISNMQKAGVDNALISAGILNMNASKLLPWQFITAYKFNPAFASELEVKMLECLSGQEKLKGKTVIAVDLSGSMNSPISVKSMLKRIDAALGLTILLKGQSEDCVIYGTAGSDWKKTPHTKKLPYNGGGFAIADHLRALNAELGYGGIFLKACTDYIASQESDVDTYIVITDSQDVSGDDSPKRTVPFGKKNYMMDISNHRHGIGYENFTILNGFSESLIKFVIENQKDS